MVNPNETNGPRDEKKESHRKLPMNDDIDHLCSMIDENRFGCLSKTTPTRFRSVPLSQVKAFRSSRLKRLTSSSPSKNDEPTLPEENLCRALVSCPPRRTFSMRFSLSPTSLINRFRSLSTFHFPTGRRHLHITNNNRRASLACSSTSITLFRTQSILPSIVEEESNIDHSVVNQPQLSCTIVDTRRSTPNACNVEELAAYLDNFLYLPKSLSGAAELMYT